MSPVPSCRAARDLVVVRSDASGRQGSSRSELDILQARAARVVGVAGHFSLASLQQRGAQGHEQQRSAEAEGSGRLPNAYTRAQGGDSGGEDDVQELPPTRVEERTPQKPELPGVAFEARKADTPFGNTGVGAAEALPRRVAQTTAPSAVAASSGKCEGGTSARPLMHVCFCWDDAEEGSRNYQPLLVAMNSTLVNTEHSSRVVFHIVTKAASAPAMQAALARHLPMACIQVHFDTALEKRIASLVTFRKTSGAREALATPFNFAPFYLDAFLAVNKSHVSPRRLIYLDTDVVLVGDIKKLYSIELEGRALAAVEDCSQRFDMYINFNELQRAGLIRKGIKRDSCVFNRGVFMMDVARWRELGLTKEIETYMAAYKNARTDLYKYGMSQPPWLLAIRGRYKKLSSSWNCRGLGRDLLSPQEFQRLNKMGLSKAAIERLELTEVGAEPHSYEPFVSTCSADANLLHFNGKLKPW
eukprot:CAMPEP_0117531258 /NCGR_PEP_ID=MMETSP0784-20121206/38766_1 /TAXON_ID=39447 /ORGANISM="" /LENGTH=472 /DNA_ID=CAMNT_0005327627 /DNA_START=1 /DNA_END=1417 /DNA_ORIENTATION=-